VDNGKRFLDSLTADAWRRFSVLRLRQKNGAKRLLQASYFNIL